jgi:hypothetical protein
VASKACALPREGVEQKSRRYLTEGRLTVDRVDGRGVRARCRGGGAMYSLGFDAVGRCAHLVALELITVGRRSGGDD